LEEVRKDHAQFVDDWNFFGFKTFKQAHDLYLRKDVTILAYVFLTFRDQMHADFGVDPCWYYGIPGIAQDAALKLLPDGTRIENFSKGQEAMYLMCESGKIGGISACGSLRHATANNPHMGTAYDPSNPSVYISYVDMNSMYSLPSYGPLPIGGYNMGEVETLDLQMDPDGERGCLLEVGAWCDDPLVHDMQVDFPCFPEKMEVTNDMLSLRQKEDLRLINIVGPEDFHQLRESNPSLQLHHAGNKIVLSLLPKKRYVVHIRLLQVWLKLGWKVKVYRVLYFNQSRWLQPFTEK